ncbi:MAG: hypothetical protein AAFP19_00030 [Bacteroidota bacterium]
MSALPSNEQYLAQLKALVQENTKETSALHAPTALNNPIIPPTLPESEKQWLQNLALLYGVPFDNLVANSSLLPPESIRFFYLDDNWINSLLDGALSIGVQDSRDVSNQLAEQPVIKLQARRDRQKVRYQILGSLPPANLAAEQVAAGFLMRSEVVWGWPGLEVVGYDNTAGTGTPIPLLRMDRLAPDVLLVLFQSPPQRINLSEPKEGLRFGVGGNEQIQIRYLGADATQPAGVPAENPDQTGNSVFATAQMRSGGKNVLDVSATINNPGDGILARMTYAGVNFPTGVEFKAAAFGVQMISTAEQQAFILNNNGLTPVADEGCPPA